MHLLLTGTLLDILKLLHCLKIRYESTLSRHPCYPTYPTLPRTPRTRLPLHPRKTCEDRASPYRKDGRIERDTHHFTTLQSNPPPKGGGGAEKGSPLRATSQSGLATREQNSEKKKRKRKTAAEKQFFSFYGLSKQTAEHGTNAKSRSRE